MSHCVILGGTGFIGRHLTAELLERGHTVITFGRRSADVPDTETLLHVTGDFMDSATIAQAVDGADYVFHLISLTTPVTSQVNPFIDVETNVRMSVLLFDACARAGVRRVIFASSGGAIYGDVARPRHKESDRIEPISPYAIGKAAIEGYLRYYRTSHGLDSMTLRISNVYGEGQVSKGGQFGIVPTFLGLLASGSPLTVLGDGSMVRDYIYVRDLVTCIATIFDTPVPRREIYNCGSGDGLSIRDVIGTLETVTGIDAELVFRAAPASFVHRVVLDCSRIKDEFGITPTTPFDRGIENTWRSMTATS